MNSPTPRLRIIAGPNGSGKSTIKSRFSSYFLGVYINPDEIEQQLIARNAVDLAAFRVKTTTAEIVSHLNKSHLWESTELASAAGHVEIQGDLAAFRDIESASYLAAMIAEFIRIKLLEAKFSFTFETVMSHPSKVELLKAAQKLGYRTYLYFIATEDPEINIARVRSRVRDGGHDVQENKIRERYERSLGLLLPAIQNTNRAYVFDNSSDGTGGNILIAEITDGKDVVVKRDPMPAWFKHAVWDKATPIKPEES